MISYQSKCLKYQSINETANLILCSKSDPFGSKATAKMTPNELALSLKYPHSICKRLAQMLALNLKM